MKAPYKSCTKCRFGYCAPKRCYCGHEECAAFASYVARGEVRVTPPTKTASHYKESWANREEDTWLDKL